MYSLPKNVYRERIDFSKIKTTVPIPNLIEIQKKSYERFLQMNRLPAEREDAGLQSVFKSVFPISGLPRELVARIHRVLDRQLGVQVQQAPGAAPPAQALQPVRRDAHRRSLRRPRSAVRALRQGQPGPRRRL